MNSQGKLEKIPFGCYMLCSLPLVGEIILSSNALISSKLVGMGIGMREKRKDKMRRNMVLLLFVVILHHHHQKQHNSLFRFLLTDARPIPSASAPFASLPRSSISPSMAESSPGKPLYSHLIWATQLSEFTINFWYSVSSSFGFVCTSKCKSWIQGRGKKS